MSTLLHDTIMPLIRHHGVVVVGGVTMLESMGVPAPGESAVIAGALYAAATHEIGIVPLVAAVAAGAIIGDNLGYIIGRSVGFRLIRRYGKHIGLTDARIRLGRYLFQRHGSKVVFFGRFFSVLRTFASVLAGANRMDWRRFLVANGLGGALWASTYGFGAYFLGHAVRRLETPLAVALGVLGAATLGTAIFLLRRHEARLQGEADRAFPDEGPAAQPQSETGSTRPPR
ncbi:membrane protein [Aliidongia dinghuensis]|uniref:Membrane protein n=1 Tax=Aliidongia dinghuensis TaxID=1867774 RepID=A0A8J3E5C9_9PROT|nr:DedA family protein [Aliidongia dinghuensis]GGF34822.1 membrane protein [Aliidongia dinghuensis]